jgi:outer membrane immunogenic protein
MKKIVLAALIVVAGVMSAFAADLPVKAPPLAPLPSTNWSGFYVGVHGGWGWGGQNDWLCDTSSNFGGFNCGALIGTNHSSNALSGGLFGGQIGYNWQINNFVVGVQGDGAWTGIKGSAGNPLNLDDGRCSFPGTPDQTVECRTKIKAMGNLTGRIGYLPWQNTLLYVKGGINWSSIDFQVLNDIGYSGTCGPAPLGTFPGYSANNVVRTSGTVGAGIEQRFANNLSVFGEYDYVNNGGSSTNLNTGGTGNGVGCTADFTTTTTTKGTNIVKFGLNYTFGAAPVVAKY